MEEAKFAASNCQRGAQPYSTCCIVHSCRLCHKERSVMYCEMHKCQIHGCAENRHTTGSNYCLNHECQDAGCTQARATSGSIHCSEHPCRVIGCSQSSGNVGDAQTLNFCVTHTCSMPFCGLDVARETTSFAFLFCFGHTLHNRLLELYRRAS